ncbi:carbohydrate kinase family protein [Patescibacteria group bacterium]|nr:carbohydrate kinase family protein [Patescibacteria group bacterium]
MDFIAIGDTVVDEFIQLKEARVHCDINQEDCTISMQWGAKIPYESAIMVPAVGNAANAAVAAARLGLKAGFISNIGNDRFGEDCIAAFTKEGVDTRYVAVHDGIPTNHHYVLSYDTERTILIRHEAYPYRFPTASVAPAWIYLSSLAEHTEAFHAEIVAWLMEHPEVKLAFQPGTFQIRMGKDALAALYARADVVAVNKEEAEQILGLGETDVRTLLRQMRALGPRIALITDGKNGSSVFDGTEMLHVPMYPDPTPPIDRTGAGDATTSTFVVALALGKSLSEALSWGPINAMSVVQAFGAQKGLLTRDALESYVANAPASYAVTAL